MKLLILMFVATLFAVSAHAETYDGMCTTTKNGGAPATRSCKILFSKGSANACPGNYVVTLRGIVVDQTLTPSAMVRVDGESFEGSCVTNYITRSANGTVGGGNISGSLTLTFTSGNSIGNTFEITFSGSAEKQ